MVVSAGAGMRPLAAVLADLRAAVMLRVGSAVMVLTGVATVIVVDGVMAAGGSVGAGHIITATVIPTITDIMDTLILIIPTPIRMIILTITRTLIRTIQTHMFIQRRLSAAL